MRGPKGRFERVIFKGILWMGIIFLIGLAVLLSGSTWEVYQKEHEAQEELDAARMKKDDLEKRKEQLSGDLKALGTERGMEAEFRERFPVAKEGEEVIVLVDAKESAPDTSTAPHKGLWGTIWAWFGH